MSMTKEDAARMLGMKPAEVVRWDGTVAVLHDGTRFEFNAQGQYRQLERVQRDVPRTADGAFVAEWTNHPAGATAAAPVKQQPAVAGTRPVAVDPDENATLPAGTAAGPRPLTPSDPAATDQSRAGSPAAGVDEEVPAGSEKELLSWVGTDQTRAARALSVEKAADKPRSGVVAKLEKLVEG